jgi:predicted nucleic acid-binding protein
MRALIHLGSVDCNAVLLNRALSIWEENNISYIDSYLVAVAELGNLPLFTYDNKLKSIHTITAREP